MQQNTKIKTLQQTVRRKTTKIINLKSVFDELKSKELLNNNRYDSLIESFSGVSTDIIANHFKNQNKVDKKGNRHNDEAKKFTLTLHFYSPRAYDYVRSIFSLPDPRSLRQWTSSVQCEPGFFQDVFKHLQNLVLKDSNNGDCALICDGMSSK